MSIFGDRIIGEIESIIGLARDIYDLLHKHKIEKSRKELDLLIKLDLGVIRRINSELGDQNLLRECYIVFNDAKQILEDVEFSQRSLRDGKGNLIGYNKEGEEILENIKRLIQRIITIEKHEIYEVKEDREKIKLIKQAWEKNISFRVVFHGTNSAALNKIKRYGLVPGMRIWDLDELNILIGLMKKAGCKTPVGYWYESQDKVIYYTVHKDGAEDYARRSPEFWSQLINPILTHKVPNNLSYDNAFRTICAKLMGEDDSRLESIPKNQLINHIKQNSKLEPKEINLGLKIFYRLWEIFGNAKPVVLHISIKAPELCKKYNADNFEDFLKPFSDNLHIFEHFSNQPSNYLLIPTGRIEEKVNNHFSRRLGEFGSYNSFVKKRIPAKYILNYET